MGVRFLPYTVWNAQAVSSTTTYTSPATNINQLANIGYDVRFSGTMTGTLSVLCSNDNITYTPLTFDPALAQPAGSNLNILISLNQVPFVWVRLQYINASGSGAVTALLSGKNLA